MARILVCEDEQIVALDIKRQLEASGHTVLSLCASAQETLDKCASEQIDLVLMDIHLRGEPDGIEASREIYSTHRIPVILLTAYNDEATVLRARESQPFGYLLKPFEERELRTSIDIALYRHSMETRLRTSEERYRSLFENAPVANVTMEIDGQIREYNQAFAEILMLDVAKQYTGKSFFKLFQDPLVADSCVNGPSLEEFVLLGMDPRDWMVLHTYTFHDTPYFVIHGTPV
jgi:CheY-like chemotaxis protein